MNGIPRVALAVNPYPVGSLATVETWNCWAPDDMVLVSCLVKRDAPPGFEPSQLARVLSRDGLDIGMPRPLPFVHDLLWAAFTVGSGVDWVGVANMDLHFEPAFFEVFYRAEATGMHAIAVHRRDRDPSTGIVSPVTHWKSMDAFFVCGHVWQHEDDESSFPDFLLGAPAWDMGAKAWTLLRGIGCYELDDGSVLHNTHTGLWRQRMFLETEGAYNRRLFRGLMEKVRKTGVPEGALHLNPRYWSAYA